jgi:tetratricopeptide (TPR) repeat protein
MAKLKLRSGWIFCWLLLGAYPLPLTAQTYPIPAHETPEQLIDRGNAYMRLVQSGQVQQAIYAFQTVIRLQPNFAMAYSNLGAAWMQLGSQPDHLAQAIAYLDRALQLDPKLAIAHYNMGLAYKERKDYPKALQFFQSALQLEPKSAETHYHLGYVSQAQGNFAQASTYYQQAIALNPQYAEAHYNYGALLLLSQRPTEAIEHLQRAISIKPDYGNAFYTLGVAQAQVGQVQTALQSFIQAQIFFRQQNNSQWAEMTEIQIKRLRAGGAP